MAVLEGWGADEWKDAGLEGWLQGEGAVQKKKRGDKPGLQGVK